MAMYLHILSRAQPYSDGEKCEIREIVDPVGLNFPVPVNQCDIRIGVWEPIPVRSLT